MSNQKLKQKGVYLGVRTCELFLCFVAIRVRVYYVAFFVFFVLLVSFTGSYAEAEPQKDIFYQFVNYP